MFEMHLNKTKAQGLLLGFYPGNDCRVIVYGMESLVTGDDKHKGHYMYSNDMQNHFMISMYNLR